MTNKLRAYLLSKLNTGPGQGLAVRLASLSVSVALLVGFAMAGIQVFFDYKNEQDSIEHQLQQVLAASSSVTAESLWTLSSDLANGAAEGLVSHPLIVEATIETITGTRLSHRSKPVHSAPWSVHLPFLFGASRIEIIAISHDKDEVGNVIGFLKLKIDPLLARQAFLHRLFVIFIAGLVKTLILAAVLGGLFYVILVRPIQRYAGWIELIDPDDPEGWRQAPPKGKHDDELSALGESIAQRFVQARAYFLQLQQTRSELNNLNQELEDRVQARTRELQAALTYAENLATTDMLTGIPNRRSFMEQAEKKHAEWLRHKRDYAVLMMDLDSFKQINDTYGHPAGDQVLVCVAAALRQHTRHEDIIGRLGGEEFCVILVAVSGAETLVLAERIRAEIAKLHIEFEGKTIPVTASFGLVSSDLLEDDFDDVLKHSDQMLYQAKREGRNRVCMYKEKETVKM